MSVILNVYNKIAKKFESKELLEKTDIESADGYIKYPNGIMEQWGYAVVPAGQASVTVQFKFPFVDDMSITCTPAYMHEATVFVTSGGSLKSGTFYATGKDGGYSAERSVYWRAIGRWK